MRPRNPDGTPWSGDTANLALQELRRVVVVDLNKRDEQLSRGRMNAENRYSPYHEQKREDGTGSTFVVDPVLSSIKHTGAESTDLLQGRWGAFCATPQDEKPYIERLLNQSRNDQLASMKVAGDKVEASLVPIPEAEMPVLAKPKPKKREPALIG